jgi:thymidylate synthase
MNNLDKQYTDLLQDILDNGSAKSDRTGTGTISVFGRQIRHNMKDGFPLLTTKKMAWKTMVTELLWFLRGDTNIKYLVDNRCHIWDGDAYQNYLKGGDVKWLKPTEVDTPIGKMSIPIPYSQEEFINKIKTDDEFAKKWGELGPVYGKQWRSWESKKWFIDKSGIDFLDTSYIDQIANLINDLKTNPDSRRLMVNAWNVGELDQMVLPPCHYGFQVYTRELSLDERKKLVGNKTLFLLGSEKDSYDEANIPRRAISLMWNQRSVDTFLGLPFNIASYGLLLEIIAKEVNMVPDELIGNLGDVHLYNNHIEQAKEQIGRELSLEERIELASKDPVFDPGDFGVGEQVTDEHCHEICDSYSVPRKTREPFELPKLYINSEFWNHEYQTIDGWIKSMEIGDFTLDGYQSYPTIKAPLSN